MSTIKDKLKVTRQEVEAYFFHLPTEPYGFLNNWYPSPFDPSDVDLFLPNGKE